MGDGTEFDVGTAVDDFELNEAELNNRLHQMHTEERAALRRVANGTATKSDAMLLAGSLMHSDLFATGER